MDERPDVAQGEGDYSYDLAHEAPPPGERGPAPHAPTYVATQTSDADGDYSYDLAHDIPPSTG